MTFKILIYRPDNIGDVVLFSGAFLYLRRLYPHAHITLAVQSHIINLVELCPYVDKVVSVDIYAYWMKLQKMCVWGAWYFGEQIRHAEKIIKYFFNGYDLVIYPVKSPTNVDLEVLADIKFKKLVGIVGCNINIPNKGRLEPSVLYSGYLDVSSENPWRHELYTTLDYIRYLGADIDDIDKIKPVIWCSDTDKNILNDYDLKKPIIGLFPSASNELRIWNFKNYGLLAQKTPKSASFIIFGDHQDIDIANKVEEEIFAILPDTKIINLTGKTTLRQLYAAISYCSILISMDSSALHMGIASGTPTIGIAGGGHFGRFVPWGNPEKNLILTNKLSCFHCNWKCTNVNIECIDGVSVDEVATAIDRLLSLL